MRILIAIITIAAIMLLSSTVGINHFNYVSDTTLTEEYCSALSTNKDLCSLDFCLQSLRQMAYRSTRQTRDLKLLIEILKSAKETIREIIMHELQKEEGR